MRLINLTKHPVRLHDRAGTEVELPPDPRHVGIVSIGDHRTVRDDEGREFSLSIQRVRGVKGMPDPADDTLYIVPVDIVLALQHEREDVVYIADESSMHAGNGQMLRFTQLRRLSAG